MHPRRMALAVVAIAAVAVPATGAGAQTGSTFRATLKASNEPGGGQGSGSFVGRFRSGNRLCFTLRTRGARGVFAAHIHRASDGSIVISLRVTHGGRTTKCIRLNADERRARADIREAPGRFYVNVHTQRFQGGAMRGTLRRG